MTGAWIYQPNADNSARFVLGIEGENPLVCVGVNPSTAVPGDPDPTVRKLMGFAARNGYDSWVMLNLYPQRSTDPEGMHLAFDPELKEANERHIAEFLGARQPTLLAAWGELIEIRPYLPEILADIVAVTDAVGCDWVSIGDPLKAGHPRHPSRARYAWPLQSFEMTNYVSTVRARAQARSRRSSSRPAHSADIVTAWPNESSTSS